MAKCRYCGADCDAETLKKHERGCKCVHDLDTPADSEEYEQMKKIAPADPMTCVKCGKVCKTQAGRIAHEKLCKMGDAVNDNVAGAEKADIDKS
jgi:ferredoxin